MRKDTTHLSSEASSDPGMATKSLKEHVHLSLFSAVYILESLPNNLLNDLSRAM